MRDPQVFLMDEPLSNLDAKLRVQTRGEIKRLQQEIGTTTVYVTHDQVEAMTMGDRIAVMNDGRLEQVGTPGRALRRARERVRRRLHRLARHELRARRPARARPRRRAETIVGVRPEHARPWAASDGLLGPLEGEVEYVEALGRETFLGVRHDEETRLVLCVEGRSAAQPGDRVRYGLVRDGLRFFDPDSGRAAARPERTGTPSPDTLAPC